MEEGFSWTVKLPIPIYQGVTDQKTGQGQSPFFLAALLDIEGTGSRMDPQRDVAVWGEQISEVKGELPWPGAGAV